MSNFRDGFHRSDDSTISVKTLMKASWSPRLSFYPPGPLHHVTMNTQKTTLELHRTSTTECVKILKYYGLRISSFCISAICPVLSLHLLKSKLATRREISLLEQVAHLPKSRIPRLFRTHLKSVTSTEWS